MRGNWYCLRLAESDILCSIAAMSVVAHEASGHHPEKTVSWEPTLLAGGFYFLRYSMHKTSKCTYEKELRIRSALEVSVRLSFGRGKKLSKWPFWYVDLNCGDGCVPNMPCDGSPIEFMKLMKENDRKCQAHFCDISKENTDHLDKLVDNLLPFLPNGSAARCFNRDNKTMLHLVDGIIEAHGEDSRYAVGAILSDPYGPSPEQTPYESIVAFRKKYPRIDLIMNINYTGGKRPLSLGRKEDWEVELGIRDKTLQTIKDRKLYYTVEGIMSLFAKTQWLITEPVTNNHNGYVVVVGRDVLVKGTDVFGFYPVESTKGQEILGKVRPNA